MAGQIDSRLQELGITIPEAPSPAANYVGYVRTGNLVFVAGQLPVQDGTLKYIGKIGENLSVEDGRAAARICALNLLAQVKAACGGDLDRVSRCVKLTGFVNSPPDFTEQPAVVNGASDLMVEVLGDKGRHSRAAVSASALPRGVAVEVEGIFEVD